MNSFLTLTLLCLLTVGQVLSQLQVTAGATSLVASITGGVSNATPDPTRWIEIMDMENNWSRLGSTYTIEAWIIHSTSGQASWQPVVARHLGMNSARQLAHFTIAIKDNNAIEVTAGCGCDTNGGNCGNGFYLLAPFSAGTWRHVAVTFNGENSTSASATLYINGAVVDTTNWGAENSQCLGRPAQWATYAPVKIGFFDDQATNPANDGNPNSFQGWWGRIDELRFWRGVRTASQISEYHDISLMGTESGLFAYYQFSPSREELESSSPKIITNKVGDWLHGLPQPDPIDDQIFAQTSSISISSYFVIEGQGDEPDLPPIPNNITFESWPGSNTTTYTFTPAGYSVGLSNLLNNPNVYAELYPSEDGQSAVLFVDCTNNDCSNYAAQWKSFYIEYVAHEGATTTGSARVYLQIVTGCPSGVFDECGTCDGDNSLCQCVVYHGFQSERMSFILLEWSLQNLISEVETALDTISSTMADLQDATPTTGELRQQISDLMTFYDDELSPYCGDVHDFTNQLLAVAPRSSLNAIDRSASSQADGSIPFVPSFSVNF